MGETDVTEKRGSESGIAEPHEPESIAASGTSAAASATSGAVAPAESGAVAPADIDAVAQADSGAVAPAESADVREPSFIVGMGGSAGGVDAFDHFFRSMPADSGLAFVLVPHLDPDHKGLMPELLQRMTTMRVLQVEDGMKVHANTVYVIPPNRDMSILHGSLFLLEPGRPRGLRMPIDFFFRQLAEDQRERAIGVILSGMGTDGTLGLKAVKEKLGMAMVQHVDSAQFDSMPRSAIGTGMVDFVAAAERLPEKLLSYTHLHSRVIGQEPPLDAGASDSYQKVFALLRSQTGHDLTLYKHNTVQRRIQRRMSVHQITGVEQYVRFLQENPHETELLFRELLIGVTNFFREPEAFEVLSTKVLPGLLLSHQESGSLRVWVPACASGEEAYSIAIIIRETQEALLPAAHMKVQVYATDINKEAVDAARSGFYPANIAADVSPERLSRFFAKDGDGYRVRKEIRELVVFAPQNLIMDPPFTRIDLLSCRNLLIYLTPELQKRLLPLFHYALSPGGFLFLGSAESVGEFKDLFSTVDNKWKVFARKESSAAPMALTGFPSTTSTRVPAGARTGAERRQRVEMTLPQVAQQLVVETVAPPAVLVNDRGDMLYLTRRTGKYLEPAVGKANMNILAMAREGLRTDLGMALRRAVADDREITVRGLRVKTNGKTQTIHLTVRPLHEPDVVSGLFLVVFEEATRAYARKAGAKAGAGDAEGHLLTTAEVEKELAQAKEQLHSTVQDMEASEEELKSANEELQSLNEELQSTNEELTTSKEELQSLNEELLTLNAELQAKNDELTQSSNDMRNLLNSTQIATMFLDSGFKVRRFTPQITTIFNLISSDVGRPLTDIVSNLLYDTDELIRLAEQVLETLLPQELQVETAKGKRYSVRIMPYRTAENLIDGVVITFSDVTAFRFLEQEDVVSEESIRHALRDSGVTAFAQDVELRYIWATRAWSGLPTSRILGATDAELLGDKSAAPLTRLSRAVLASGDPATATLVLEVGGRAASFRATVEPLRDRAGKVSGVIGVLVDLTACGDPLAAAEE